MILIIYDTKDNKNMTESVEINRLVSVITELQDISCTNISIEYNDNTYWLSENSIDDIVEWIMKDMASNG